MLDDNWRSVQLEILNVQTGETRALTWDSQVYLDPKFSPDGGKLAYVSTTSGGNLNVAIRPIHNGDWSGQEVALTRDHRFGKPDGPRLEARANGIEVLRLRP